ncbi:TonB-dependent receptor [Sphingobacterium sp. lm-10]|uniref:SusC/RagA family TonB-linked outer membrane protein n=1 Tax=Sphingobacterium sp. lm-10 TaxID=2944904 RepID=UPI002021312D|nr:TonB-dependent receptor [Sphingobacterium sp. lm-10]MCL7988772.1 TonB-dependent receptor [Sphingobacterium sp. lm-10]
MLSFKVTRLILSFLGIWIFLSVQAQDRPALEGRVVSAADGSGISGATVSLLPGGRSTSTDESGNFRFTSPGSAQRVSITAMGFQSVELPISGNMMTITLSVGETALEDIVVIGYGSVKRKDVTTAISSVSLEDVEERPIVSAAQAIQGRAAGVSVVQTSGTPGGQTSIRIRGATSFNGSNDPLYVVDNVPVDNINFLAPTDIVDMQVLKDASSAAIYGSRAANGVILITTKQGKAGQAKIGINTLGTINQVTSRMQVLNAQQYRDLQQEIGIVNVPAGLTDQTDWFNEAYKNGLTQNYQVSISDGTEKLRYHLSGGYVGEDGVLNTAFFKRYNFRANIENNVRDWLKINANMSYSDNTDNGIIGGTGANRGGVVLSVINTPTYAPIWNPDFPNQYYNNFFGVGNITHPLENMERTRNNKSRENRLVGSGSATILFTPDLTFKSLFAVDRRNGMITTFLDPITTDWGRSQFGTASDARNMNTVLTFDNILTYDKRWDKHQFEAMGGSSWTSSQYQNSWINGSHFINDYIQTLNAANRIAWDNTGTGASQWSIMSYFARATYNYDGRYILTGNVRADGSSKLHPDYRWGVFPSMSAAWRLSAEDFLSDVTWLNDLKIRGGWGQTGNQSGVGDYAYLELYSIQRQPWFETGQQNALPLINQSNLRTRDLTWETTTQTNLGVDFTGFDNRLTVNLDVYHKYTRDMLMYVTLPSGASVAGSLVRNEGEMLNRGLEVNVNSRNLVQNFVWTTDFNISFNRNRLEKLELQQIYNTANTAEVVNEPVVRNTPGQPLGRFFGYIADGVDPETGDMIYRDLNGDGRISPSDRTFIGDPNPKFTFGLTNNFSYKGLNLSVFLQGSYGNDVFNASRMEMEGMYDGKNQITRVLDRWQVPGQITDVPRANYTMRNSTYFVENGSFLRLKNLSLSYNIQTEALKRIGVTRLQPFVSATNLLTWTNYTGMDPEVNQWGNSGAVQGIDWGTYPQIKSYVLGVNLDF